MVAVLCDMLEVAAIRSLAHQRYEAAIRSENFVEELNGQVDGGSDDWCAQHYFDTVRSARAAVSGKVEVPTASYSDLLSNVGYVDTGNMSHSDKEKVISEILKKTIDRVVQYSECDGNYALCTYDLSWKDIEMAQESDREVILNRLSAAFAQYPAFVETC